MKRRAYLVATCAIAVAGSTDEAVNVRAALEACLDDLRCRGADHTVHQEGWAVVECNGVSVMTAVGMYEFEVDEYGAEL